MLATRLHSYDAARNNIATTDRQGRTTQYQYDALNRLTHTIFPDGSSTGTTYNAAGWTATVTDANGNVTSSAYDATGHLIASTDGLGKQTQYAYDAVGNQIRSIDSQGNVKQFKYDALNRLTQTTYPNGTTTSTVWRTDGGKQSDTDPLGNVNTYGYDADGRLSQVTQTNAATQQQTVYGYDNNGNKISQTDANGNFTKWGYDAIGHLTSRTLPAGQQETYRYDVNGNLTGHTDFIGNGMSFAYNNLNELIQMKRADGSTVITAYTPNSQVANVTVTAAATGNPIQVGQTSYTYDANDRLTKQTNPDGSFIAYGFDAAGNILQRSTAVGTVQYTYDSNGQIATVTDASGKTTNYTYNSVGRPDTIVLPNGTAGGYSYDINGRLLQLAHQKTDGTVVVGVRYTLASNGQRIKVEEYDSVSTLVANVLNNPARTYDYQYDLVGRLTQDKRTDRGGVQVRTTTYAYDQVGNRTTKTEINGSGTTTTTYSYDANDRLTTETKTPPTGSAIVTTYAWDANGNLISKIVGAQATFYSWSSDNRLAMVMQGQSEATAITIAKFTYDASGNRIGKIEPGQNGQPDKVTTYLIDSSFGFAQVVLETVTFGSTTTSTAYTWGNGLIAQSSAGQQSYFYSNGLNSTVALADAAGNTTDTYSYEAFGAIENRTGITVNSFRFAGEYADDTIDNIYLRDRWLDQNIGRFISMDRFPGSVSRPATLNKYNYAHSDPVNGTDPSGMMTLDEIGETLDIEGTLTSMVKDQLGGLLQNQIYGDDDTVDGQPSLYDMMMGMLLKTVAGSFSMAAAPVGFTMMAGGKTEGHHVIPEYMCGAAKQELVDLPIAAHKKLHNELFAFDLSVTVASKVYDLLFKKKKSGQLKSPINKIARTSQGRAAIAIGLGIFYENYGYDGVPFADLGHGRTTFLPVGPVLLEEAVRFAGNDHQYSATIPCKKY